MLTLKPASWKCATVILNFHPGVFSCIYNICLCGACPTSTNSSQSQDTDSQPFVYVTQRGSRRPARVPLANLPQEGAGTSGASQTDSTTPLTTSQEAPEEGAGQPTPRTLRSCHSTPDCKKPGVLSASLFNKPKRCQKFKLGFKNTCHKFIWF